MNNDKKMDDLFEESWNDFDHHQTFAATEGLTEEESAEIADLLSFTATLSQVNHPRPSPAANRQTRARLFDLA